MCILSLYICVPNYAMTSLYLCHAVVLQLTDISIKLLEYRSKWTRKAKIEQKLLNMERENLHVRLVNLFLFAVCIAFMLLKILVSTVLLLF